MYWNTAAGVTIILVDCDKLQHEMYWNDVKKSTRKTGAKINYNMRCIETLMSNPMMKNTMQDKLQHEMYWNFPPYFQNFPVIPINYNMRCIETCKARFLVSYSGKINYNMRCIETLDGQKRGKYVNLINYNMRCIETITWACKVTACQG